MKQVLDQRKAFACTHCRRQKVWYATVIIDDKTFCNKFCHANWEEEQKLTEQVPVVYSSQ